MRFLWLLACLLFASCADDQGVRYSGGSAVEGETVTARLLDGGGVPLARVAVRATSPELPAWSIDEETDAEGVLRIPVPAGAREVVLVLGHPDLPGQKLVFRIRLRPSLDTTLVARKWGGLAGRVGGPEGWTPVSVSIDGLGILAGVQAGEFAIGHLPPGTWPLVLRAESLGTSGVFDLGTVTMPEDGASLYREFHVRSDIYFELAFDEFAERGIACVAGDDFADSSDSGLACAVPAGGSSAWSGTSVRLHLEGGPETPRGARFDLVPSGNDGELLVASSDTLAFMARGTGRLEVVLGIRSPEGIRLARAGEFRLASTWKRHAWPASVWLGSGSCASVAWIGLATREEAWVVLDELELSGR